MLARVEGSEIDRSILSRSARVTAPAVPVSVGVDASLDRQKILFTMEVGVVWFVGVAIATLAAAYVPNTAGKVAFLALFWTVANLSMSMAGISYVLGRQREGISAQKGDAWRFVRGHLVGLSFGSLGLLFLALLTGGLGARIAYWFSSLDNIGPVLGGMMLIPTFFGIVIIALLTINLYWLPFIMGAEACSVVEGSRRLLRLVFCEPFKLVEALIEHGIRFAVFGVVAFWSGIVTLGCLVGAIMLVGRNLPGAAILQTIDSGTALQAASAALIVYAWVAFMVVFAAVQFTEAYFSSLRVEI